MKKYFAAAVAVAALMGSGGQVVAAQLSSSSEACVSRTECQSVSSNTLTSSVALTGSNSSTFASAHTGLLVTQPFKESPRFLVQSGASGLAASAAAGSDVSAGATWTDHWQCAAPCGFVGPWWGKYQWVLHLEGVVSPSIITGAIGPGLVTMRLGYRVPGSGYSFSFGICIDGGACAGPGSTFAAGITTPAGDTDLTSRIVLGTNAAGQRTMSLDVKLGTDFCLGNAGCAWNDEFTADAQIENGQGNQTLLIDFSGTFIATAVSLDPDNSWVSDGGRTAPKSPDLISNTAYSGTYRSPLVQSTSTGQTVNSIKNGRVIPVKVQLQQNSTIISDQNAPGPITIRLSGPVACSSAAPPGDIGTYADAGQSSGGTNQFRYDATTQTWIYNLDTRALGLSVGSCYRIDAAVNGTTIPNAFVIIRPTM